MDSTNFKEERIRNLTLVYYSREDVRKALFEFSKDRECIPRYFEAFGKRPDNFQYESDILEQVKKGATSFHCSEELWEDPLEISTNMNQKQFNEIRKGWDLLLDIDSPYLEYSKIYAEILIDILKLHNVEHVGVKYSGNKGFHIIIPWKAFPEEIYNEKTKNMFPEWPRIICQYLGSVIRTKLAERILQDTNLKQIAERTGREEKELIVRECVNCKRPAIKKFLITWTCEYCKNDITNIEGTYNNRKKPKCPDCRRDLYEKSRKEIYACDYCNINSEKNPETFDKKERVATEKLIDADLILVAPRHLFRMPYSLHEKTALASIVIDKNKIKDFQINDAQPLRINIKNFYPNSKKEEAKNLLLEALDWSERNLKQKSEFNPIKITEKTDKDYKKIVIPNPTTDLFPPQIRLILHGIKSDGRKRALFILLSFFKSLGMEEIEIEKRINEWNEKNYNKLKEGYIKSQIIWYRRNSTRLPPNFNNPIYKDLGVDQHDELTRVTKNPVNYTIKKFFQKK